MIRVLIVDDSPLMRRFLDEALSGDPELEVVGAAADPLEARELIKALNPDVITLDVEMPRMDGLSFLERLMRLRPTPVVMVSRLTQKGAEAAFRALALGAVDFIGKPSNVEQGWQGFAGELAAKVKAAAGARVRAVSDRRRGTAVPQGEIRQNGADKVVAIGASTGGVEALKEVIAGLPADCPPILVAQHMPSGFTERFAAMLDSLAGPSVAEARHEDAILPGHVYVAPGNRQMRLARARGGYICRLSDEESVNGHRPSVDVLFDSVALTAGGRAVGVILSGMGRDGAAGLARMREAGAVTLGQDESTCLIYGMPRAAKAMGAVARELPIHEIARAILQDLAKESGARARVALSKKQD